MRKIFMIFVFLVSGFALAQIQVVLQNGSRTETFENLNDAMEATQANDTIYLPGFNMNLTNNVIDKPLHWVGTGHYPQGTTATGITKLSNSNGSLYFTGNCDGSTFEGIQFDVVVHFGNATAEADGSINDCTNINIKRCRFTSELNLRRNDTGSSNLNFRLQESVLYHINAHHGQNCYLSNNLFSGRDIYWRNFENSIFQFNTINSSRMYPENLEGCLIENNAFVGSSFSSTNCTNNLVNNNIYNGYSSVIPIGTGGGNTGTNNIYNESIDNLFTTYSSSYHYYFRYNDDYHMKPDCRGIGAATDGTDLGMYGGVNPYKAYSVPFYPHITTEDIDAYADSENHTLHVKFTVEGQQR